MDELVLQHCVACRRIARWRTDDHRARLASTAQTSIGERDAATSACRSAHLAAPAQPSRVRAHVVPPPGSAQCS